MPAPFRWYPDAVRQTGTGVQTFNLGVNPISLILLTIRAKATAANANLPFTDALGLISSLTVLFDQEPCKVYANLLVAYIEAAIAMQRMPMQLGKDYTAINDILQVTIPIMFGNSWFDKNYMLPPRAAGRNQITFTGNATSGAATLVDYTIEELQLLGVAPKAYIKSIQWSFTPSGTGETDIFLSLEKGRLLGVLLGVTTPPAGITQTGDIDWVRFLIENEVWGYYQVYWELLHGSLANRIDGYAKLLEHVHESDVAAAYTQYQKTRSEIYGTSFDPYAYLDFDPLGDMSFAPSLDVKQASVHPSYNTAAATKVLQRTLIPA